MDSPHPVHVFAKPYDPRNVAHFRTFGLPCVLKSYSGGIMSHGLSLSGMRPNAF